MQRCLAVLLVAACGTSTEGPYEGLGTPEDPVPQQAEDGPYDLRTTVDFTIEAILPPQAHLVVVTLRAFADNPARTLITVADEAGVPAVGTLYGAIPGIIRDRLEGWINDEIAKLKINGRSVPEYAGDVAALAETALTRFALDSTLAIDAHTATHTLVAFDLSPAGIAVRVPIGGFAADHLTQQPTIGVAEGGALSIGDQRFGLAYGEYAWQGLNAGVAAVFGADIRTSLGTAVNCPALAQTIASKCVLGVCVGHETELLAICELGLDAMVNQVHARFAALRLDVFRFVTGNARLIDDDADGLADRIVDGTWDSEMNLGLGLRRAPASFEGAR
jgi:hypothetical protein